MRDYKLPPICRCLNQSACYLWIKIYKSYLNDKILIKLNEIYLMTLITNYQNEGKNKINKRVNEH